MKTIIKKINRKIFLLFAMALAGTGAFSQAIPDGPTYNCNSVDLPTPTITVGTAPVAQCPGTSINLANYVTTDAGNTLTFYYDAATTQPLASASTFVSATRKYYVTATSPCSTVSATDSITVTAKNDCDTITSCSIVQACTPINLTTPTLTNATGYTGSWEIETAAFTGTYTALALPYSVSLADEGKKIQYKITDGTNTYRSPNVIVLGVTPGSGVPAQPSAIDCSSPTVITDGSNNVDFEVTPESDVTYKWEAVEYTLDTDPTVYPAPANWFTITSGDGTYKIRTTINTNGTTGTSAAAHDVYLKIRVTPSNGCGTGPAQERTFSVKRGS